MHQDFKELLSAFNAGQVRYLIVGGYAVSFHAQPRATKDLDILIGADAENRQVGRIAVTPSVERARRCARCASSSDPRLGRAPRRQRRLAADNGRVPVGLI